MRGLVNLALLGFLFAAFPVSGVADARNHDRAREAVRAGQIRPLNEIIAGVTARYPGKVVDVDLRQGRGGWVYRIKILRPGGRVLAVSVDAGANRIISVRGRR